LLAGYSKSTERSTEMSQKPELYTQPAAMEPLLPEASGSVLADLTCDILRKS
jgi:hypothetical protein